MAMASIAAGVPYEAPDFDDEGADDEPDPELEKQLQAADHRVFFSALQSAVTKRG